jgi:hypothetical protein
MKDTIALTLIYDIISAISQRPDTCHLPPQKSEEVPQKPYWLQQVFKGQVFPGTLAYWPHSAVASH